jgi:asparagine synthase (glutamine-hydrolysing)
MCGVVGIFQRDDGPAPARADLERMLAQVRHRGPDAAGLFQDDEVGLGLARLSIIDLEGGLQPLCNEDGSVWVICNGEVFNYVELRAELEGRGHRFRTSSDCETIVHLYEELGSGFVHRLNGQFACAVWDRRRGKLLLVRDRLGIRPLFYAQAGGRLLFASEIKALLSDPVVSRELDPVGLAQVFTYWAPLPPRTMFRQVRSLRPGHMLELSRRSSRLSQYWKLEFGHQLGRDDEEEAAAQLRSLLADATRIRLRADVPVGSYLSGGLDSAVVTALARRQTTADLHTFGVAFDDGHFDESGHQERVARELATEHHTLHCSARDIGEALPEVVWHAETPLLRSAPVPLYLLAEQVHSMDLKVVLTGEGADEFQLGYDIFKEASARAFWARDPGSRLRPRLLRRLYADVPEMSEVPQAYLEAFFGVGLDQVEDPSFSHMVRWANGRRLLKYLSPEVRRAFDAARQEDLQALLAGQDREWEILARAQYNEAVTFLDPYLLSSQGDRVAMAHAVEGRFPFLDVRVVEYSNSLPARLKMHGLSEKTLLRRAVADLVPRSALERPKRPFRAPIQAAFSGLAAPDYAAELLDPGLLAAGGYLQPAAVANLAAKLGRGERLSEPDNMALMGVVSFGLLEAAFAPGASGWQAVRLRSSVVVGDLRSGSRGVRTVMPEVVSRLSTA